MIAGIAPFVQQVGELGRKFLAAQAIQPFLRLDAGEAYLSREREHVGRQPRGQQRVRRIAGQLRLRLGEPARKRFEHLDIGGDQQSGERHILSFARPKWRSVSL